MLDLIPRWPFRTATNRPLRFTNRVVLCFENLETRTLLSSGVFHAATLDNPMSAVALVAEPANVNATATPAQQGLSDVVGSEGSSKVLSAPHEQPDPTFRLVLPDPLGLQMLRQLERTMTALMNLEAALLNPMLAVHGESGRALEMPGLNTGTKADGAATSTPTDATMFQVTLPLEIQPLTEIQLLPNSGVNFQALTNNPSTGTTTTTATGTTSALVSQGTSNQGSSSLNLGTDSGTAREIHAPIQFGPSSNGGTGLRQANNNTPGNGSNAAPMNGSTSPTVVSPDAARLLQAPTAAVLPGQGATGGTLVGGQVLLPGVVTTPPSPSQQIQAGILNTADPYARFEQTILTKEGFKTASGEETPPPRDNRQPGAVRALGAFEEEETLDLLDPSAVGTEDQAALRRHKTDAFFADKALVGEDHGWYSGNSAALAGAMLILGGFWGVQVQKTEERKRRQSILATLRKWLRR